MTQSRQAVLSAAAAPLQVGVREIPVPAGEQVLVRVLATGVCRTDLHLASGADAIALPRVLGHEVAGWVDGLGAVLVYGAFGCGACESCAIGDEQLCPEVAFLGRTADGGFADHVLVPSLRHCVPLGDLEPTLAAPLADAGLTAYRAVTRALPWMRTGGSVLVIGAGGLGSFAVQLLCELTGAAILVCEIDPSRLAHALASGPGRARAWTERDRGADVVLDFVGSASTLEQATASVRIGGVIVVIGSEHGPERLRVALRPEVTVVHSIWGSLPELVALVALAGDGGLRLSTEVLPLEAVNEALERLAQGRASQRIVLAPPVTDA